MKLFLKLRVWLFLFFACLLTGAIVLSCSDSGTKRTTSSSSSSSGGDETKGSKKDKDDDDDDDKLSCSLPSCSGSDCCSKDDDDCDDWCTGNKFLDLSGTAAKKCLSLDKDVVEDLKKLFDKTLDKPSIGKLEDLEEDDIELMCAGVKDLDSSVWSDRIKKYNSSRAKSVLEWIAGKEEVLEVFENAEDDDGLDMFKDLLRKVGSKSNEYADILSGLRAEINTGDDSEDRKPLMALADKDGNEDLIRYIHEYLILDEDEGICGKESRRPEAEAHVAYDPHKYTTEAAETANSNFREEACILAVYCTMDDNLSAIDGNKFRKAMADTVDSSDVISFIKTAVKDDDGDDEGGLTPADSITDCTATDLRDETDAKTPCRLTNDQAEEWSDRACHNLNWYWRRKEGSTELYLDL